MIKKMMSMISISLIGAVMALVYFTSDSTPPTITVPDTPLSLACIDVKSMMHGVMAYDNTVDISNQVIIENMREIEAMKAMFVIYAVEDKAGNVAKVNRLISYSTNDLVVVTKQKDPIILINSDNKLTNQNNFRIGEYYQATNGCGMDVSDELYIKETFDSMIPGIYPVTLLLENNISYVEPIQIVVKDAKAKDSAVNEIDEEVDVNTDDTKEVIPDKKDNPTLTPSPNTTSPVIVFKETTIILNIKTTFTYMSPIQNIEDETDDFAFLARRIRVTNYPDMLQTGTYSVNYAVTNSNGVEGTAILTVQVVDSATANEEPTVENDPPLIEDITDVVAPVEDVVVIIDGD